MKFTYTSSAPSYPLTIASKADWEVFCDAVNNGHDYSGETVTMTADVTTAVTTMAGTTSNPFRGTFNGQGHTLNVNISSSTSGAAPFQYINGATIKDLEVTGTVTCSTNHASGLVGFTWGGENTIQNCLVSTNVNVTGGYGLCGGIIGHGKEATNNIIGCAYTGALTLSNIDTDRGVGGLYGWSDASTLHLTNCIFAGTVNNHSSRRFHPLGCFDGSGTKTVSGSITNCYYTLGCGGSMTDNDAYAVTNSNHGIGQTGKFAYSITPGTDVTVTNAGTATNYQYSGITGYGTGIKYNDVLYAGNGDNVSLTLGCTATGYQATTYSADHGTLSGSGNPYTLAMEAFNTVISGTLEPMPLRSSNGNYYTWEYFAAHPRSCGSTIYLERDINVTSIVEGSSWQTGTGFNGTFDGQGHTITLTYNTDRNEIGLFKYTYGVTIKNLRVEGEITTSSNVAAGIIGLAQSTTKLENCISDVNITCNYNGNGQCAGLVGGVVNQITFTGCAFTGSISGDNATANCGFVGKYWYESQYSHTFTNCLFAPSSMTANATNGMTFAPTSYNTFNNCYYTEAFGTEQGTQAYSVTGVGLVTVARSGSASNTYSVSGITAYSPGLNFTQNNVTTIYAGSGETIGLTLSGADSYHANHGTLTSSGSSYSLVMDAYDTEISVNNHTLTTSVSPVNSGTIDCSPEGTNGVYTHGTSVELTATPETGYAFLNWTIDGNTVSGNPTTVTMDQDHTVVANFELAIVTFTLDITGHQGGDGGWHLITSPLDGTIAPTAVTNMVPATATNYDLYYFDPSQQLEWINYKESAANGGGFGLVAGKGYLYANRNTVTLTFTGVPYQGDGQVLLTNSTGNPDSNMHGLNLVGNPYNQNAQADVRFYAMNSSGTEIVAAQGYGIGPLEGIFVQYGDYVEVNFSPTGNSKSSPSLALNITQGGAVVDRAIIGFDNGGMLRKFQLNPAHTKVFIPRDDSDYAVVNAESDMGEMPVSFVAESNGSYTLSVNAEEVRFDYLHLIDNLTGVETDLLANPSYSFNARTTDYASRFRLVFATCDDSLDNFGFYSNGSWVITNDGEATLQVVDVTGRILKSQSISGCANVNFIAAPGVYMLRLVKGENVRTQKVVVR